MESGTRIGPYEVLAPLGAGGMGEVYRARDPRLGREVAVKVLPAELASLPGRLRRFEHEARATSALNHPNILTVYDVGTHGGVPYLVTELLEGETLREKARPGSLTPPLAVGLARQAACGLAAAHAKGIVHRDIKPENLFLTRDGTVKILDFGLAKLTGLLAAGDDALSAETTQSGTILGTAGYMSPEQVRAQPVDGRSDVFSLGCVLHELLSGQRTFSGATHAETMAAILHAEPAPLRPTRKGISPGLEAVVRRCLAKRPEDRFASAHDLAVALETISLESGAMPGVRGARALRPWLMAAIVGAAFVGVLAYSLLHRDGGALFASGTPRRLTSGPGWEAEPALSPDGTLVAFTTYGEGSADVFVLDVSGGDPLRLTSDPAVDLHPAWSPDGASVLFASDRSGTRSIWKVPRLGGSATLVMENADFPAVSRDGRWLSFSRSVAGKLRLHVAPLNRGGDSRCLTGDRDGLWDHVEPAWSPDGLTLAYADQRDLWLVSANGGGPARALTSEHANDRDPAWSGDGQWVYFASKRGALDALWRVPSRGGIPQRVTMGTGPESHPDISWSGARLVYSTFSEQYDVTVVDLASGRHLEISSSVFDSMPAVAPDGGAVVFVSNRSGSFELWKQVVGAGAPEGPPVRLTDQGDSVATPVFRPDGEWVAYFRTHGANRDIWMVPVAGGPPAELTDDPAQDLQPAFSPDGRSFAFVSNRSGEFHVWVQPLPGERPIGSPWQLTTDQGPDYFPAWSPDGRSVAFNRCGEVWLVEARQGASPRRLTADRGAQVLRWEPGGTSLLVRGKWAGASVELRRVSVPDGRVSRVNLGRTFTGFMDAGSFDLSRDGRVLAIDHSEPRGDIWVVEGAASR